MLSAFHDDHTFGIAWLILVRVLMHVPSTPLRVFGPTGTTAYLEQLLDLAWGEEMRRFSWERLQLTVQELAGGDAFEAAGVAGGPTECSMPADSIASASRSSATASASVTAATPKCQISWK